MFYRTIGKWTVGAGEAEGYREAWGEDGPYTERVPYLLVQATSQRGKVYGCARQFANGAEARIYLEALPEGWDAAEDADWNFDRNIYGSEAYQANWHEEEWDRMDAGERRNYF